MPAVAPDFVAISLSIEADVNQAGEMLAQADSVQRLLPRLNEWWLTRHGWIRSSVPNGVMVARGDPGVEVGDAQLIGIQKELISRTRQMDRLVITATQMMESMISNSMPTRAEVFDVANAVLDGTDAVMLSAETAVGQYPVEVVAAMADAALGAERHPVARTSRYRLHREFSSPQEAIALSAMYGANHFPGVRGLACLTEAGTTPTTMSRLSSGLPIFALSRNAATLQPRAMPGRCATLLRF